MPMKKDTSMASGATAQPSKISSIVSVIVNSTARESATPARDSRFLGPRAPPRLILVLLATLSSALSSTHQQQQHFESDMKTLQEVDKFFATVHEHVYGHSTSSHLRARASIGEWRILVVHNLRNHPMVSVLLENNKIVSASRCIAEPTGGRRFPGRLGFFLTLSLIVL